MTFSVVKLHFLTTFLTSNKNDCGLLCQSGGEVLAPRTLHSIAVVKPSKRLRIKCCRYRDRNIYVVYILTCNLCINLAQLCINVYG